MSESSLRLFPLTSTESFAWPLSSKAKTLLYFFSDLEAETVPRLHTLFAQQLCSFSGAQVFVLSVYTGESVDEAAFGWVAENDLAAKVFWTGAEGLASEVCAGLEVTETPTFLVLQGGTVVNRLRTFPDELLSLIEEKPEIQVVDYESFAEYLSGPAKALSAIYESVRESSDFVDAKAVVTLLEQVQAEFKLELTQAASWFETEKCPGSEDTLNPNDITEEDFKRRLIHFCRRKPTAVQYSGRYEELWSLCRGLARIGSRVATFLPSSSLRADKERILALTAALDERDATIAQLRKELAAKAEQPQTLELAVRHSDPEPTQYVVRSLHTASSKNSLLSMPSALIKTPPSSQPAIQTLAIPQDEYDFWKYGQEEDWEAPQNHPPKFEEIAAAKGLWIVTAESSGLANTRELSVKFSKSKTPVRGRRLPPLPEPAKARYSPHSEGKRLPMPVTKLASKSSMKSQSKQLDRTLSNAGKLVLNKGSM